MFASYVISAALYAALASANVSGDMFDKIVKPVIQQVNADIAAGERNIEIKIDSNGGSLDVAYELIRMMDFHREHNGAKFTCTVRKKAYSAAFLLLSQCDERIVDRKAKLMWHPMKVGLNGFFKVMDLLLIGLQGLKEQDHINNMIAKAMRIPFEKLRPNYEAEKLMPAQEVAEMAPGFISVVNNLK
jgi:ATP-dependent protease ClpP protease subunit